MGEVLSGREARFVVCDNPGKVNRTLFCILKGVEKKIKKTIERKMSREKRYRRIIKSQNPECQKYPDVKGISKKQNRNATRGTKLRRPGRTAEDWRQWAQGSVSTIAVGGVDPALN